MRLGRRDLSDIGFSIDAGTLAMLAGLFFFAMSVVAAPLFFVTRYKGAAWGVGGAVVLTVVLLALSWQTVIKLLGNSFLDNIMILLPPLLLWLIPAGVMIGLGQAFRRKA
jgi:hypothetical protein